MSTKRSNLALLLIVALLLSACSKEPAETSDKTSLSSSEGLLKYVPADTPYLLAMPTALPDDVLDALEPQADLTL